MLLSVNQNALPLYSLKINAMIKNTTLILIYLLCITAIAQQTKHTTAQDAIAEAEMKTAYKTKSFKANPHTGSYDIGHQTLELTVDPAVQFISGKITSSITATENLTSVTFDLNNSLTVTSVTQNGNSLSFSQNNSNELVVILPQTLTTGTSTILAVTYSGVPDQNSDAFVTATHGTTPVLWTLSEPYGAKDWWPCKQDLNDKIDGIDVFVTAPSQYVAVSNGLEQAQTSNKNGTKTTHFKHNYPIPAYLVAIAVSNYSIFTQTAGIAPDTFPIVNYIYPEFLEVVKPNLAQTLHIMSFFEQRFEKYPFASEKYGHAQCGFGGGMEHTTVSFMGSFGRDLIAHELAHQWFGDKITCGSWKDIWLNEGFATFLTGLSIQHLDGEERFKDWKKGQVANITSQPNGSVYLTDSDTVNVGRIFSSRLTYNKGSMVLNMLRFKLGNDAFYSGVKSYLADNDLAYGYAKTPDLQAHLERASDFSLTEFFNDWVYNQGYPSYQLNVSAPVNGQVVLTINQSQSHSSVSYFEMPLPIRFWSATGEVYDTVVQNTKNNQQFTVAVPFAIARAAVNDDSDLITGENTTTLSTYAFNLVDAVTLYPNPASNQLNLHLPEGLQIQKSIFYNALGQKVIETTNQTSWDVGRLSAGVHFITLVTNHGSKQLKFVKE